MDEKSTFRDLKGLLDLDRDRLALELRISQPRVKNYLRRSTINATVPPDEVLDQMKDLVVKKAGQVLKEAEYEESKNPLSENEFATQLAQVLDMQILIGEDADSQANLPATYFCTIMARNGRLGHINVPLLGFSLAENRAGILEAAWAAYKAKTSHNVDPESELARYATPEEIAFAERNEVMRNLLELRPAKARLRQFRSVLSIDRTFLSRVTGRSKTSVDKWTNFLTPVKPPALLLQELQRVLQNWASDVLLKADGDRELKASQLPLPTLDDFLKSGLPREIGPGSVKMKTTEQTLQKLRRRKW